MSGWAGRAPGKGEHQDRQWRASRRGLSTRRRSQVSRPQTPPQQPQSGQRRKQNKGLGRVTPRGRELPAARPAGDPSAGALGRPAADKHNYRPPCREKHPHLSTQLQWGWKPAPKIRAGFLLTAPPSPASPRLKAAPSATGQPLFRPAGRPRSADWKKTTWEKLVHVTPHP